MKHLGIKLRPKSALHLGQRENWLEGSLSYIHSDTLFQPCATVIYFFSVRQINLSKPLSQIIRTENRRF